MIYFEVDGSVRMILELVMAAFLGGIIGLEREIHGEVAGFRTNILICLGACLMMQLSMNMEALFKHLDQSSVVRLDPARIASYAIASMGFLGAGAIVKGHGPVRGLTTAAGLWLITGVGLSVGSGFYIPALVTVVISIGVLYGLRKVKPVFSKEVRTHITLQVDSQVCAFSDIEKIMADYDISIEFVNFRRDIVRNSTTYDLRILFKGDREWREIAKALMGLTGVNEISWTEA